MNTVPKPTVSRWSDFFVLPENRSAVRAARSLARALLAGKRPRVTPVVFHGPPGTGKSRLATTLVDRLAAAEDVITARSVSAGDLARSDGAAGFADRDLLACDLLVLEDVQLLPPRDAGPVSDLLDRRTARRKATVVTANAGPAGLGHLPRALTSRLAAGLVVQLGPPSQAGRRRIAQAAAAGCGLRLTPDALDWLAAHAGGLRPLLGLIRTLAQLAPAFPGLLDRTIVEDVVAGSGQPTSPDRGIGEIVKRVAAAFGVSERELLGPSRLRAVMVPRQVAMYLARAGGLSLPRIGAAFGRDHTTVLHACRKVEADLATDARMAGIVADLRTALG